jgi:hypothetical protein
MNRKEADARLAETRFDAISIAEHLNDQHGIRPEARDITDPKEMSPGTMNGWARRYGVDGYEDMDSDDLRKAIAARQKTCVLGDCPGVKTLQDAYNAHKATIVRVIAAVDEASPDGEPQAIQPRGLDVAALTGAVSRAGK